MTKDYKSLTKDISEYVGVLGQANPEVMTKFSEMSKAATADGALSKKTKELIALAISVTQRCDGCIGFHVRTLHGLGVTKEEVAETMGMCVYMGGGPALMYAADAMRAFDQFAE